MLLPSAFHHEDLLKPSSVCDSRSSSSTASRSTNVNDKLAKKSNSALATSSTVAATDGKSEDSGIVHALPHPEVFRKQADADYSFVRLRFNSTGTFESYRGTEPNTIGGRSLPEDHAT